MQAGSKKQSPLIFILPLIILFAAGFSYWFIKLKTSLNDTITTTSSLNNQVSLASVELDSGVRHFLSTKQKIEFDYPSIFGIVEKNNGQIIDLTSLYYVLPDPINPSIPANEALPPHYFSMSFETRDLPLEEAMKQENPYFSETYLNLKTSAKKPIPDYPLEIKKIANLDAYSFPIGAEGFNSRYTYIQKEQNKTIVIIQYSIGDFLKDIIKPKYISETEQEKAFDIVLQSLKIN